MGMDAALGALYDNQSDGEPGSKENKNGSEWKKEWLSLMASSLRAKENF